MGRTFRRWHLPVCVLQAGGRLEEVPPDWLGPHCQPLLLNPWGGKMVSCPSRERYFGKFQAPTLGPLEPLLLHPLVEGRGGAGTSQGPSPQEQQAPWENESEGARGHLRMDISEAAKRFRTWSLWPVLTTPIQNTAVGTHVCKCTHTHSEA